MKPCDLPLMSIVVPVYNRALLVGDTLRSLAAQTASPIEVVLVDNGSSDGSYELLRRWRSEASRPGLDIVVDRCLKRGAAAARNRGLALARSGWVMFFDSDDIMPPGHVARAVDAIMANPDADVVGWDYISAGADGKNSRVNRFFGRDMEWNNLFHGAMSSARWCARTALVREVGGWNEAVGYWDDIELGARMLKASPRVVYTGLSGIKVLEHSDSITATHAADPSRIEPALASIAAVTGRPFLTDIKRAIEYGLAVRAGNPRGRELMAELLGGRSVACRAALRFAYAHTARGLRGAAALLKPFCRLCRQN